MRLPPHAALLALLLAGGAAFPVRADDRRSPDVETAAAAADGATIFRVFLTDGTSFVSYGEPARVGDRIVFSMPTTAVFENPPLHLVNLAAGLVDWPRTERYADAARAAKYYAGNAEADYAALTGQVAAALAAVAGTTDPAQRLAIVEKARRTLADWPRTHFNYREAEIQPMLGMLDEIVAELRALAGGVQFDLAFVARSETPAPREPLLPHPTPKEMVEQVLAAARLSESSAERVSLLSVALGAIERDADRLPSDWRAETRLALRTTVAAEIETDRQYQLLTTRILAAAEARANAADVRGVERLRGEVETSDGALGRKRPDAITGLLASLEAHLDAARALRLAHDRWALRKADFRAYGNQMTAPLARLRAAQDAARRHQVARRLVSVRPVGHPARRRPGDEGALRDRPAGRVPFRARAVPERRAPGRHGGEDQDGSGAHRRSAAGVGRIVSRRGCLDAGGAGAQRVQQLVQGTPPAAVITPRRTRLIRVPDLGAFRRVIGVLSDRPDTIVIVPNRAAARQLARSFTRSTPQPALVLTRDELYVELHARIAAPRRLTAYEREAIAQSAALDASQAIPDLPFRVRPGLVAEMVKLYDQLRRQSQTLERFGELIEQAIGGETRCRSRRRADASPDPFHPARADAVRRACKGQRGVR